MTRVGSDGHSGFTGTVVGWGLPDILQVCLQGRFSGALAVELEDRAGRIVLSEGRIVDAEEGDDAGEQAFYEIMQWTSGRFRLEPGAGAGRVTIDRSPQFLLLEACRIADERLATHGPPPAPGAALDAAVEDLRRLPGVAHALLQRGDAPLGGEPEEAQRLGAAARYILYFGKQLGSIRWSGPVVAATLRAPEGALLLCAGRDRLLAVQARDEDGRSADLVLEGAFARLRAAGVLQVTPALATDVPPWDPEAAMECDAAGAVLGGGLTLALGAEELREAALLVSQGMDALEAGLGRPTAIDFRYHEGWISLWRTPGGFALSMGDGAARFGPPRPSAPALRPAEAAQPHA
jgi:Domain of unknown function (DUF4388)